MYVHVYVYMYKRLHVRTNIYVLLERSIINYILLYKH